MGDSRNAISGAYMVVTFLACMMVLDYVGVVRPEILTPNFLFDMLVPLAFTYALEIRFLFVAALMIISWVTPASDMVGDTIARSQKAKIQILLLFLICTAGILGIHKFPFLMFSLFYPILFLGFISTSFIIANLLKRKRKLLDKKFGFERINESVSNDFSFNWYSERDGHICVENPFRGILILGSAGSGKSYSFIEPIIEQAIEKNFTGLIFDFKMAQNFSEKQKDWALTRFAYMAFLRLSKKSATKDVHGRWIGEQSLENDRRRFYIINFRDVRYSHRVNPINPQYMETQAFANEYAMTLMQNLNPKWIKDRDFFAESAIIYLKAIFWFLKSEFPEFCTLPHAVTMALMPHSKVLATLSLNAECREIISSIIVAEEKNAEGQISGVVASLQVPIDRINSPELFWVLSESDFSLHLNNPEDPGVLCLGSDPELQETYSPVCALIATVCRKVMNRPGMLPSIYLLDEAPQLAVPRLADLPASARSNFVVSVICGQDKSQFIVNYGKENTDALFANLSNQFFGQIVDPETSKMVSEMIGTREKENRSINSGKSMGEKPTKSTGENLAIQRENLIHNYEIQSLEKGRFVGKVAETSKPYSPFFNVRPDVKKDFIEHEFPMLLQVPEGSIQGEHLSSEKIKEILLENYRGIKKEAQNLVDRCARTACLAGLADELKVFPKNFHSGNRIVTTLGIPMFEGVIVDPDTGFVSGVPDFDRPITQES